MFSAALALVPRLALADQQQQQRHLAAIHRQFGTHLLRRKARDSREGGASA